MKQRSWLMIALVISLGLTLAACGAKSPTPAVESTQAPAKSEQTAPATTAKPAAAPTATPLSAPTAEPTPEESDLSVQSRDTGLDQLASYRAVWHAEWKSTEEGKTSTGMWDWEEKYTTEPTKARYLFYKTTTSDDPTKIDSFELWQIGDTMYMKSGSDEQCIAISSEDTAANLEEGFFSPTALGSINDARYVGRETVNDIPAKHYKYTNPLLSAEVGKTTGDFWVAIDGGYIVKDMVTWKGGSGFLGLGGTGSGDGSWTWEITDANKPIEIIPAEECRAQDASMDFPIMPDAREKSRYGGMMSYTTDSTIADVAAFYKEELTKAGWAVEGEPTETGEMMFVNYTKDGKTLNVMISVSDGATQVILNLSE